MRVGLNRGFTVNPDTASTNYVKMQDIYPTCNFPMYIFVADQHEAPSTHIRCCLKTEIFFWFWPTVHMYQVKMAIENASFQKRSQSRGFELAILLHSCGCTKMEVFGNKLHHGVEYQ